ncbi:unnamed protein product [Oikopleura dioica]|uniref:Uncharacterized protein n=1 Tax=Oikopleura dioica TaxID=34765 RepID=E4WV20_OIKDI|nr:unnamed protein product [Oikopleura dioica]
MVGIGRACGLLIRRRELAMNLRVLARGNQGKEKIDKSKLDKWGRITPEFKDPYEAHFYKIHGKTPDEVKQQQLSDPDYAKRRRFLGTVAACFIAVLFFGTVALRKLFFSKPDTDSPNPTGGYFF